jgi:hypothetical protein
MIYHSNAPYGDIENGIYIDSKKRQWKCSLTIGKWFEPIKKKEFDAEVLMEFEQEKRTVSISQFREFTHKKTIIKI